MTVSQHPGGTLITTEFPVPLGHSLETGLGNVLVTDLAALVQPSLEPDWYYQGARHDVGVFYQIMSLGDYDLGGSIRWTIVTVLPFAQAREALSYPLHCYIDSYCHGKVGIEAVVTYHGPSGPIQTDKYGWEDGSELGMIDVYPAEYWECFGENVDPSRCDWSGLLQSIIRPEEDIAEPVGGLELEDFLSRYVFGSAEPIVVVRPSPVEPGFIARGFGTPAWIPPA